LAISSLLLSDEERVAANFHGTSRVYGLR